MNSNNLSNILEIDFSMTDSEVLRDGDNWWAVKEVFYVDDKQVYREEFLDLVGAYFKNPTSDKVKQELFDISFEKPLMVNGESLRALRFMVRIDPWE